MTPEQVLIEKLSTSFVKAQYRKLHAKGYSAERISKEIREISKLLRPYDPDLAVCVGAGMIRCHFISPVDDLLSFAHNDQSTANN